MSAILTLCFILGVGASMLLVQQPAAGVPVTYARTDWTGESCSFVGVVLRLGDSLARTTTNAMVCIIQHPDAMAKHADTIRDLLLVGDRNAAVDVAVQAQMWPEAMLIASFTGKDEYKVCPSIWL